jgi:undecaprenyl pyrophosphate phosphatase UppP
VGVKSIGAMNFLNKKTSWSNFELWLLKICVFSVGIVFGIYFYDSLKEIFRVIVFIFFITLPITIVLWLTKMKQ